MTPPDDIDLEAVARTIGGLSDAELATAVRDDRESILELIFASMERRYRGADKISAVVHWEILERPGGGSDVFETVLGGGRAQASRTPRHKPQVHLQVRPVDLVRLVTGHASGTKLYARRRLRAKGNLALAARIPTLFAIPGRDG